MPATDPINPNVDPLIYRLNAIYGQEQAAALEAEGKEGIIYNSTYTNFWEGAMAWAGWWHNEVGLLTEVASARIATPITQQKADPSREQRAPAASGPEEAEAERRRQFEHPGRAVASASRYYIAHGISAALARRQMDAGRYRRLRIDSHVCIARSGGGQSRDAAARDLRRESAHD